MDKVVGTPKDSKKISDYTFTLSLSASSKGTLPELNETTTSTLCGCQVNPVPFDSPYSDTRIATSNEV